MAITKPYTFVAGTKAKAVEVNEDFDVLYSETNRIGTEIINLELDIQDVNSSKANINGDATQRFQLANPENSYDGVNKNYLEGSIANVKDYISGYVITKNTSNSIRVSSGSCYDSTFTTIISSTGNITKTNSTQSANATYYVYVISDASGYNANILITTSSTNPPLPSGYTLFRRIGNYNTNSSGAIKYIVNNSNSIVLNSRDITGYVMPNYSAGINIAFSTFVSGYTAPSDGVIMCRTYPSGAGGRDYYYTINGVTISSGFGGPQDDADIETITILVSRNDKIKIINSSVTPRSWSAHFYPCKGDN